MPGGNPVLEALTDATVETLSTMAMLDMKRVSSASSDRPHEELLEWTTFMVLVRDDIKDRMMVVSLSRALVMTVVAAMLGMEENELEDESDLVDGVGELGNMVAGMAKAILSESPEGFTLTLPLTVPQGGELPHAFTPDDRAEVVTCEVAGEPIQIGLWTLASPL